MRGGSGEIMGVFIASNLERKTVLSKPEVRSFLFMVIYKKTKTKKNQHVSLDICPINIFTLCRAFSRSQNGGHSIEASLIVTR